MNRRKFLGTSALAAASLAVPSAFASKKVAANDKVVVALIGCGGMGNANLGNFMKLPDFDVGAVCDVDQNQIASTMRNIAKAKRPTSGVKTYDDYRKMIDERSDLDAVIIGTPDHHHAFALSYACAAGKAGKGLDVYCEKPLSHNIVEGRAMVNAARKQSRIVQIGTWQRSGNIFRDAVAYVKSGKLGHVYRCRTWITNRDAKDYNKELDLTDKEEAPAGVNYDVWLGPAPQRKFNAYRFHHNFRWFWDYGSGLCNDWGVHLNDIIMWAMDVRAPLSAAATGGKFEMKDTSDTPDTLDITYEYPKFTHIYTVRRGVKHGLRGSHGMEWEGANGTLTLDRGGWRVTPAAGSSLATERHRNNNDNLFDHIKNFLDCVRNRSQKTASDIEDMHRATTTCHLANISYKVKRTVYWDAEKERCFRGYDEGKKQFVIEDTEANAYLFREPRAGWKLAV